MNRNTMLIVGIVAVVAILGGVLVLGRKKTAAPTATPATGSSSMQDMQSGSTNNAQAPAASNGSSNASSPTAAAADKVEIKDFAFSPATITVKKGATVTWTNQDGVGHTVTSDDGNELSSETFSKGQTFTHTFNTVGTFQYHCQPHPYMKGTVVVTE
jgi:plastocyanin